MTGPPPSPCAPSRVTWAWHPRRCIAISTGATRCSSALILSAYEALAVAAEQAADNAEADADTDRSDADRWSAVPRAIRRWALEHPHQWGLIFGTPVPGYEAPKDTVEPYARVAVALVRRLVAAHEAGRLRADPVPGQVDDDLRRAVAPVVDGLLPGLPVEKVVRALQTWITIVGAINLEVFGHWRNTVLAPELLFEAAIRDAATSVGLE